jgi:hypothetical protein
MGITQRETFVGYIDEGDLWVGGIMDNLEPHCACAKRNG